MNHIIFIRHGQSLANHNKVIAGITDIGLTQNGFVQAKNIVHELLNKNIDVIICSPLLRAKQTCETINTVLQIKTILYDKRLQERNYGKFEGKTYDAMDSDVQGINFWDLQKNVDVTGADKVQDYYQTVQTFFNELSQTYHNKNILVISHGGVYRILTHMLGNTTQTNLNILRPQNATIYEFNIK